MSKNFVPCDRCSHIEVCGNKEHRGQNKCTNLSNELVNIPSLVSHLLLIGEKYDIIKTLVYKLYKYNLTVEEFQVIAKLYNVSEIRTIEENDKFSAELLDYLKDGNLTPLKGDIND